MSEAHLFAIGIVLAWLAGVRVYLTVFGIGVAGWFGWLDLPPALGIAQSPWVMGVSGTLALEIVITASVLVTAARSWLGKKGTEVRERCVRPS